MTKFKVRDYECDQQGIVNNAVYLNYLEHARHEYLETKGLSFSELTKQGLHLVVSEVSIKYKDSLRAGDIFSVTCEPTLLSPYRVQFKQEIVHQSGKKMAEAIIIVAALDQNKKLTKLDKLFNLF